MNLSDIFKFTQGLGQKGHQIGRKVGDAIELLTLGLIKQEDNLVNHLVIEDGVEGATSAKHKVEFSFYNLDREHKPSKKSEDLFGIIECKKVGVEQTIKSNFKKWKSLNENKTSFNLTNGYDFIISPTINLFKWRIIVTGRLYQGNNICIEVKKINRNGNIDTMLHAFSCDHGSQVLVAVDTNNDLFVIGPGEMLSTIELSVRKCIIVEILDLNEDRSIKKIHVNESLAGPQTPEKAKQASFVSLDVRKKVLGRFDKTDDNKSFISVLVIGEASHWEAKSRAMVRLCNDYNLVIPDEILVYLFREFERRFGENYQDRITKNSYKNNLEVRELIFDIINNFNNKIMFDLDTNLFYRFKLGNVEDSNRLLLEEIL